MDDRIKLAKAMGWTDFIDEVGLPPGARGQKPITQGHGLPPDPFTDANDDYAVLEWMRLDINAWEYQYSKELALTNYDVGDYEIGDYARAALTVINDE